MSQAFTVSVSHNLGAADARGRIQNGIQQFRSGLGSKLSICEETWTGNHLDFKVGALGQVCSGTIDVLDNQVRLEVFMPGVLGFLAKKIESMARKNGQLLLGRG